MEERAPAQIQLPLELPRRVSDDAEPPGIPIDRAFPEEAANELARLESYNKHLYRPNTCLHKWWARRSGTTFRHILKQLVVDPVTRDYYEPGGLEGQVVLDPMLGGGTTLHEAIRLGANVVGVDVDPIPVVQALATLSRSSVSQKRATFRQFFDALKCEIGPLFETTCPTDGSVAEVQFTLYGLRRRCSCKEVLFVDSFVLRQDHDQRVHICRTCHQVYVGTAHLCRSWAHLPLVERRTRRCVYCGSKYTDILDEPFTERYVPLIVVGQCKDHGQFFKAVSPPDLNVLKAVKLRGRDVQFGDQDGFRVPSGPKSDGLLRRGITSFLELFTPRQLLYLRTCHELLSGVPGEDRVWLSLLISTSLEFNSLLCGYKGADIRRPGAVRRVFSHHAYSFPCTALENNPVFSGKTSGTLRRLFSDRIVKAGHWAAEPVERRIVGVRRVKVRITGEMDSGQRVRDWESLAQGKRRFLVLQDDAAALDIPEGLADWVVTDPPHYDNVPYNDLSTFFRVWLRLFLPDEADWHYDPLASAVSEGDRAGQAGYGDMLGGIWQVCHKALKKPDGRLIVTFHHWSPDAWSELTLSLERAEFMLVNRYVVFSENPTPVGIKGLKTLKHNTILVLCPRSNGQPARPWAKPDQVDASDSYAFCRDCGTALGHLLAAHLDEDQIRQEWRHLLEGKSNG